MRLIKIKGAIMKVIRIIVRYFKKCFYISKYHCSCGNPTFFDCGYDCDNPYCEDVKGK